MSHKQILFHSAAREKVLRGATALADAVRVTLGPKSKSVLIGRPWGSPIVDSSDRSATRSPLRDPPSARAAQFHHSLGSGQPFVFMA